MPSGFVQTMILEQKEETLVMNAHIIIASFCTTAKNMNTEIKKIDFTGKHRAG